MVPDNVWLGVSVENIKEGLPRIEVLKKIPAKIRFLSIEPCHLIVCRFFVYCVFFRRHPKFPIV
jgi:protein gp37